MKKTMLLSIALSYLLSGVSPAVLVDDFESYETGPVDTVTTNWKGIANPELAVISVDPLDAANKVLGVTEFNTNNGVYGILSGDAVVENNTTKTLFLRVLTPVSSATAPNTAFGLIDLDIPPANCWGSISTFVRLNNGGIQARDGSGAVWGPSKPLTANTWYNVWITCNHTANNFQLYVNTGNDDATAGDQVGGTYAFRASHTNALDRFVTQAQGTTQILFDDINISPGVDLTNKRRPLAAHNPTPANWATGISTSTTLTWHTGVDPANPANPNPAITKHYVYFNEGDPNFVGQTPQEITASGNPTDSCNPPVALATDKTYYWRVDESVNDSSPSDPNTIQGSAWSFETQKSTALITTQPADTRVFTTDPNAAFTVTFTCVNPVTATWYKNGSAIAPDGTNVIVTTTDTSSTLQINTPELTDEGKYYCILSVSEGTNDDVQTATRLLVIKKTLAQFDFENNLNDSSGNAAPSGVVKTVSLADPNELLATAVGTPSYVSGIGGGLAIYLDGTQFIDFGTEGYPKAGPLDTIGDIRGPSWEKQGFGRGMDEGSILCWVKPASSGTIYSNANAPADDTHFALTTNGTTNARIIVRGENPDGTAQVLGEANGAYLMEGFDLKDGQWHLFAATWNTSSTARIYINGELAAFNTQGYTEVFKAWERSNLLGTSRTSPNRWILDAAAFVTGAIDKLRVYNYVKTADEIAQEYETISGKTPCANHAFSGSYFNFDNTASSYCKVDLGDFAEFAAAWLADGLYAAP